MNRYEAIISRLRAEGNFRSIPAGGAPSLLDFSTNDYLGIAANRALQRAFLERAAAGDALLTSSASRLLAAEQADYTRLEEKLADLYGRSILLFNSGYHANTGLIAPLADKRTLIAADKLVHASIIDGIRLSEGTLCRWRHNDYRHLQRILDKEAPNFDRVLIVAESIYSMDGDSADLEQLTAIKRATPGAMLYIDEAHAMGVIGPRGLGLWETLPADLRAEVDILIGTFGKACASMGAFAAMSPLLRDYAVNRSRSFIFSTALPPVNCAWTAEVIDRMTAMTAERRHLRRLAELLHSSLANNGVRTAAEPSHILPVIVGDARRAVELSRRLLDAGIKVLPIRTPTVPPGTERLRISLSAANSEADIHRLANALTEIL